MTRITHLTAKSKPAYQVAWRLGGKPQGPMAFFLRCNAVLYRERVAMNLGVTAVKMTKIPAKGKAS